MCYESQLMLIWKVYIVRINLAKKFGHFEVDCCTDWSEDPSCCLYIYKQSKNCSRTEKQTKAKKNSSKKKILLHYDINVDISVLYGKKQHSLESTGFLDGTVMLSDMVPQETLFDSLLTKVWMGFICFVSFYLRKKLLKLWIYITYFVDGYCYVSPDVECTVLFCFLQQLYNSTSEIIHKGKK